MKSWFLALMMMVVAVAFAPSDVQAKRLGSGKSSGMQRDMPARTAPDAPPPKPATPAQATNPATAGAPAAAAAPAKRSWLGPIAGLAAGLGLAALMSHMGMGEGFANIMMMVLLAAVAFFVIRWVMRRMSPQPAAATSTLRTGSPTQVAWPNAASPAGPAEPVLEAAPAEAPQAPAVAKAFVPASFDNEAFERAAKLIFIRLQAANDAGDLEDLRSFTTPEMFASTRLELQERGGAHQQTDVLRVDAQVLDVVQEAERQLVSVRFHGELREEAGAAPTAFNEIWHLTKPLSGDGRSWAVAGIEQLN